jgi:hypothetical protein
VLRVVVREDGRETLPPIDIEGDFTIGGGADARVRLPAAEIAGMRVVVRAAGVGAGKVFVLGRYRVDVAPSPPGAIATPPQRTESLARELLRDLLGTQGAPSLTIERGTHAGATRLLAPPESVLVIGRGDEAGWVLEDDQLSRAHIEVRRGWDGLRVVDLGSKNGTNVDGVRLVEGAEGVAIADGTLIEIGGIRIRVNDPAHRIPRPTPSQSPTPTPNPIPTPSPNPTPNVNPSLNASRPRNPIAFWAAVIVFIVAVAGLIWLATS